MGKATKTMGPAPMPRKIVKSRFIAFLAAIIVAGSGLGAVHAAVVAAPAPNGAPVDTSGVTEAAIQKAIDKAVDFLYSQMNKSGTWDEAAGSPLTLLGRPAPGVQSQPQQYTALILNALAAAGQERDPRFIKAFDWLMAQKTPDTGLSTYTIGLRLQLLASLRLGAKYREQGNNDLATLLRGENRHDGLWTYAPRTNVVPTPVATVGVVTPHGQVQKGTTPPPTGGGWGIGAGGGDFSNTNYAVLGLWGAMDERFEVPTANWEGLEKLYAASQYPDGSWGYNPYVPVPGQNKMVAGQPTGYGSMTTAAIASLYLILDYAHAGGSLGAYRNSEAYKALGKGLEWLTKNFDPANNPGRTTNYLGYYFYNCERVGTAGGLKYFGKHNWYPEIAATILSKQKEDGSLELGLGGPVDTAFAVLFLSKGGGTVLMNKLQHSGDWDNRFRDVAGAVDWLSRTFERPGTWQSVTLPDDVAEITDSRILFISGAKEVAFTPAEQDKLRRYVQMGGLLVFNADGNSQAFHDSAVKTLGQIWPGLEVAAVDVKTHPLGNMYAQLNDPSITMETLASPTRVLAVILGGDAPAAWERRAWLTRTPAFTVAANLYTFATDKTPMSEQPRRLFTFGKIFSQPMPEGRRGTITLARINYSSSPYQWDPEPLAWERFGRLLSQREGVRVDVKVVTPQTLAASGARIAHLAGWDTFMLTPEQTAAIVEWIKAGGTLIVEQAGGRGHDHPFDASFRGVVGAWFPRSPLVSIERAGSDWKRLGDPIVYRNVKHLIKHKMDAELEVLMLNDRPAIIYSPYDLQTGLLACPNPMTSGPEGEAAYQLVSQMLLKLAAPTLKGAQATATTMPATAPAAVTLAQLDQVNLDLKVFKADAKTPLRQQSLAVKSADAGSRVFKEQLPAQAPQDLYRLEYVWPALAVNVPGAPAATLKLTQTWPYALVKGEDGKFYATKGGDIGVECKAIAQDEALEEAITLATQDVTARVHDYITYLRDHAAKADALTQPAAAPPK
jgi:hypothetical protein